METGLLLSYEISLPKYNECYNGALRDYGKIAIVPIFLLFFFVLNLVKYIFSLYFCENVL